MTYQALARKWRPQDFSSLIGQEAVVTALRNALVNGRVAQAYLFAGIRGVGKTTAARVLAKALNCENGPAADPCNACGPCLQITKGGDLDVLEIDAATYSKVEQVRELVESLKYGPARDRYKVVVLDEVHRLSRQAFDALLKIVEEPPPHLVFVFATTEVEAVPVTILSRCQEYRFRRVATGALAAHLRAICDAEAIAASDAALAMVARAGDGSVRDAVALLDQLATYGSGTLEDEAATRLLGAWDPGLLHTLLAAVAAGDGEAIATRLRELEQEGGDPRQLYVRLLSYLREGLHLCLGAAAAEGEMPAEEEARLAELGREIGYENLLRMLSNLLAAEPLLRRSEVPALALEIALLRAAELPKLVAIEGALAGGAAARPGPARPQAAARSPASPSAAPRPTAAPAPAPAVTHPTAPPAAPATPAPGPAQAPVPPAVETPPVSGGGVADFLQVVTRKRQMLAAHLEQAHELRCDEGALVIVRPAEDAWLEKALERPSNRETLDLAVREVWGPQATWRSEVANGVRRAAPETAPDAGLEAAREDPAVQAILDIFDGTIQGVDPARRPERETT